MIDPRNPDYTLTPVAPQRPCFSYTLAESAERPYVTVVTPFYNTGALFHETAATLLHQSFQQWEWYIVNDGSTDGEALSTLAAYRQKDPRIHVVDHRTNQGASAARNTGFRHAQSPYIVQLDSDDLLEPTAVEKWLWFLESHSEYAFVKGFTVGFGAQNYLWHNGFHSGRAFLKENVVTLTSMIRTSVCRAIGGYDEANRAGLEDWDFWLHCANMGYWGGTVPEYLDWYRRRPTHQDRWQDWDGQERQQRFQEHLRSRYPHLWQEGFPAIQPPPHVSYATLPEASPCGNSLSKVKPRLLLLLPWLTMGGADKFNLDVLEQLTQHGWEVSIATTLPGDDAWFPRFARVTPDIFLLPHFLRLVDYPRFLRYLIQSRQIDVVLVSNSELGYLLLPYLRAYCPEVTLVDFCHMEETAWKNGGYPRAAVAAQHLLDLSLVSSAHLQAWMQQRGADAQRLRVCYTNVDVAHWAPEPKRRAQVRRELAVDDALPIILYAGRICAQKQPRVFAHTVMRLARLGLRFVAVVAGDGPDLAWLRAWSTQQGCATQIRFLGAVSNERIHALMTAVDVFFLPSQWEGIALVLYEAMACGLPVVGADVGGQRELVPPECGVLLPRSTEEEEAVQYAQCLAELLTRPQQRHRIGQAARARVAAAFRLEQLGQRLLTVLHEARRFHAIQPRVIPDLASAQSAATQAIEYTRLAAESEQLWHTQRDWRQKAEAGETVIQKQRAWLAELEHGKGWLVEQWEAWLHTATTYEQQLQTQQAWNSELERAKAWLEQQRSTWQALAEERTQDCQVWQHTAETQQRYLQTLQSRRWFRLLVRLRLLPSWRADGLLSSTPATPRLGPEEIPQ